MGLERIDRAWRYLLFPAVVAAKLVFRYHNWASGVSYNLYRRIYNVYSKYMCPF